MALADYNFESNFQLPAVGFYNPVADLKINRIPFYFSRGGIYRPYKHEVVHYADGNFRPDLFPFLFSKYTGRGEIFRFELACKGDCDICDFSISALSNSLNRGVRLSKDNLVGNLTLAANSSLYISALTPHRSEKDFNSINLQAVIRVYQTSSNNLVDRIYIDIRPSVGDETNAQTNFNPSQFSDLIDRSASISPVVLDRWINYFNVNSNKPGVGIYSAADAAISQGIVRWSGRGEVTCIKPVNLRAEYVCEDIRADGRRGCSSAELRWNQYVDSNRSSSGGTLFSGGLRIIHFGLDVNDKLDFTIARSRGSVLHRLELRAILFLYNSDNNVLLERLFIDINVGDGNSFNIDDFSTLLAGVPEVGTRPSLYITGNEQERKDVKYADINWLDFYDSRPNNIVVYEDLSRMSSDFILTDNINVVKDHALSFKVFSNVSSNDDIKINLNDADYDLSDRNLAAGDNLKFKLLSGVIPNRYIDRKSLINIYINGKFSERVLIIVDKEHDPHYSHIYSGSGIIPEFRDKSDEDSFYEAVFGDGDVQKGEISKDLQGLTQDNVVELYQFTLSDGTELYFTSNILGDSTVNATPDLSFVYFGGQKYIPLPIESDNFKWDGRSQFTRPKIRIGLGSLSIRSLFVGTNNDLLGVKIRIIKTFRNFLDNGEYGNPVDPVYYFNEVYHLERKSSFNKVFIEYELANSIDHESAKLPKRQALRNICTHRYRVYKGYAFDYNKASCPYAGSNYFLVNGNSTTDPEKDQCGKKLSDCRKRFGDNSPLPIRSFPGMDRAVN